MAYKTAVAIALGLVVAPAAAAAIEKRITGGTDAVPGDFPYIVSLKSSEGTGSHHCGGSLLDSTTVVTAAHCTTGFPPESLTVSAGSVTQGEFKAEAQVQSVTRHPTYLKRGFQSDDIAVLKLSTPIEKSDTIDFATLPEPGSDPVVNSSGLAAGWGYQSPTPTLRGLPALKRLSKVTLPVHERDVCANRDEDAKGFDTLVCAGGDGKSVCRWDSGGPLADEETGQLMGVASWVIADEDGNFCGKAPGLFTRVASYIPFILENMKTEAKPPPTSEGAGNTTTPTTPATTPTAPSSDPAASSSAAGEVPTASAQLPSPAGGGKDKLPFKQPGRFSVDCGWRGFDEETCGTKAFCEGFDQKPRPWGMSEEDEKKFQSSKECFAAHEPAPNSAAPKAQPGDDNKPGASDKPPAEEKPPADEKLPFEQPGQFSVDCGWRGFDEETCGTKAFCEGFDQNPRPRGMSEEDEKKFQNSKECFEAHQPRPETDNPMD